MTVAHEVSALIATFADRSRAERFVKELKRAGFQDDEIGMLSPNEHKDAVEEDTMAGVITGGALGAVAGAMATGVIPGIGPVIAAGILAGVIGGAAAGAAAGGILGALISLGVPEDQAHTYEQEFLAGRTLVVVQALGRGGVAMDVLQRCNDLPVSRN